MSAATPRNFDGRVLRNPYAFRLAHSYVRAIILETRHAWQAANDFTLKDRYIDAERNQSASRELNSGHIRGPQRGNLMKHVILLAAAAACSLALSAPVLSQTPSAT